LGIRLGLGFELGDAPALAFSPDKKCLTDIHWILQGGEKILTKNYEEEEEKEKQDILQVYKAKYFSIFFMKKCRWFQKMDEKSRQALRNKRSFFVRMVSDPKIYNPKIVDGVVKMKSFDRPFGPFMYEETPNNQTA